ncbi:MAG: hypothetical protein KC519_09225 [Anaerolineae bacterium]|nr:hypothetical protein [Anaerolineae bacterium]
MQPHKEDSLRLVMFKLKYRAGGQPDLVRYQLRQALHARLFVGQPLRPGAFRGRGNKRAG